MWCNLYTHFLFLPFLNSNTTFTLTSFTTILGQETNYPELRERILTARWYRPAIWSPDASCSTHPLTTFSPSCCCSSVPGGGAVTLSVWITSLHLSPGSHWPSARSIPSLGAVMWKKMRRYRAGFTTLWKTLTIQVMQPVANTYAASSAR